MQTQNGRLLILDDDPMVGGLLVYVAQAAGFEARLCDQASDFFATLALWPPSHVAIDLTMPNMNGLEVLRALAAVGCTAQVIICSGAGGADTKAALDEAKRLHLRTAGLLPKPFSLAALRALLADTTQHTGPGSLA